MENYCPAEFLWSKKMGSNTIFEPVNSNGSLSIFKTSPFEFVLGIKRVMLRSTAGPEILALFQVFFPRTVKLPNLEHPLKHYKVDFIRIF